MPRPERTYPLNNIPIEAVKALRGKSLFYPHSFRDIRAPIKAFVPWISDFWFADVNYPAWGGPCLTSERAFHHEESQEIEYPETTVSEAELERRHRNWTSPHIYRERYIHLASGQPIWINLCRGDSYETFCRETFELGIFFYRGDSCEGSNHAWNAITDDVSGKYIGQVLERLVDGGLIVTDGSRVQDGMSSYGQYSDLARFQVRDAPTGHEAMQQAQSFADFKRRRFSCVGYVGARTLIWQVNKPQDTYGTHTT